MKLLTYLLITFFIFTDKAIACSVCFGGADSNLIRGFTWGVGILLLLPFLLLGGLFSLIYFSMRKHKHHV